MYMLVLIEDDICVLIDLIRIVWSFFGMNCMLLLATCYVSARNETKGSVCSFMYAPLSVKTCHLCQIVNDGCFLNLTAVHP